MTPARLTMIRTIAANCRTSARQITGPTAEQLNAAADVIGELIGEVEHDRLLAELVEYHGRRMAEEWERSCRLADAGRETSSERADATSCAHRAALEFIRARCRFGPWGPEPEALQQWAGGQVWPPKEVRDGG